MPNSKSTVVTRVNKTTIRFRNPLFRTKIVAKSPLPKKNPRTLDRNFGCVVPKKPVSVLFRGLSSPLKKEMVSPTKLSPARPTARPFIDGTRENVIATWSLKKPVPFNIHAYKKAILAKWHGEKTGLCIEVQ